MAQVSLRNTIIAVDLAERGVEVPRGPLEHLDRPVRRTFSTWFGVAQIEPRRYLEL